MSADSAYNTSKVASEELLDYLLGGSALNYVGHRAFVHGASAAARREIIHVKLGELARQTDLAGGQKRNRLHRQRSMGHGLALYLTALMARSYLGRNHSIIFASDMG